MSSYHHQCHSLQCKTTTSAPYFQKYIACEPLANIMHSSTQYLTVYVKTTEQIHQESMNILVSSVRPLSLTLSCIPQSKQCFYFKRENTYFRFALVNFRPVALMQPSLAKQTWLCYIMKQRTSVIRRRARRLMRKVPNVKL